MTILMLIVGIVLGAAGAYLIARVRLCALSEQIGELRAHAQRLDNERAATAAEAARLREQLGGDRAAANNGLTDVRGELAMAQAALAATGSTLKAERQAHEERLEELREMEKRIDERV